MHRNTDWQSRLTDKKDTGRYTEKERQTESHEVAGQTVIKSNEISLIASDELLM